MGTPTFPDTDNMLNLKSTEVQVCPQMPKKNPAKRRYVTSVSLFIKILVTKYRVEVGWAVTKYQVGSMCGVV